MQIIRSIRRHPGLVGGCVLTVGNFDGLHLGHQAIIERVRARAAALSLPAVMMSFDPMPGAFFRPDAPPARLTSLREKLEDAAALGIDCFVRARFDAAFAAMSPQTFLEALIAERLGGRQGHFVGETLLDSQLATLEPLQVGEAGFSLDISRPVDELVDKAMKELRPARPPRTTIAS